MTGNPNPPRTTVEGLDEPREVVIDFDAFCTFEEVTGTSYLFFNPTSALHLRGMLYAGLKSAAEIDGKDLELSLKDVGRLLSAGDAVGLAKKLRDMRKASMPEKEEGADPTEGVSASPPVSAISG